MSHLSVIRDLQSSSELSVMSFDDNSGYDSDESSIDVLNTAVIHDDDDPILLNLRSSQEKTQALNSLNKKRRSIQCRIVNEKLTKVTEMIEPIKWD